VTEQSTKFYIDGRWVAPVVPKSADVINPATEAPFARISLGSAADVDRAVNAARAAFQSYSQTTAQERIALLERILEVYKRRLPEMATTITAEMGAPVWLANRAQAPSAMAHVMQMIGVLKDYAFESRQGTTLIAREPIGVCAFITPWNWPINQLACKVIPALAAGCTMVVKPSEIAPLSAMLFAEILHEAGVPGGVLNLINGEGATVGQEMASHPGVDLVSFTGSTRAGIQVAKAAADTVKRVHQELGGKSANILLPDADLEKAVTSGVDVCFRNSGQSCNAPTRMLVQAKQYQQAVSLARAAAERTRVGDPTAEGTVLGPVVSAEQFERIQRFIQLGIEEGATLVAGGPGRPEGLSKGYYVRPTVFADVRPRMRIAREEIFGPVLCMLPYETEAEAIAIANDTIYGLASYVQSSDSDRAKRVASELRVGQVIVNDTPVDFGAPFGGYKQSGNGREWGKVGFEEFLEIKSVLGGAVGA
jgi:aldehyde dehydrogenase (NAD+)